MTRWLLWMPLAAFLLIFAQVASGLLAPGGRKPPTSRLVGQPMPTMTLPALLPDRPGFGIELDPAKVLKQTIQTWA